MTTCDLRVFQRSKKDVPYLEWISTLTQPSKRQNLDAVAGILSAVKALIERDTISGVRTQRRCAMVSTNCA